jgi:hypothetical protein
LNVKQSPGATVEWRVEVNQVFALQRVGWNKDTVVPGMDVRVGGYPAKNGDREFVSTTFTILATQRVFKTPPGCWAMAGETLPDAQNLRCTIPEVP